MMTPQQQQILVRSALATGVTLAIGLVSVGFISNRTPSAAPSPSAGTEVPAVQAAGQTLLPPDVAQDTSFATVEGMPADTALAIGGESRESARAFEHEDDDDEDEDAREHRERERGWNAFLHTFERREHR
ncbi:MAG: hypothetical protein C4558_06760 [Dehalococcoidia bacterium]|nr:MAG: hypothetical protein C4558_06760 [Dehalococcoidia bacterium]